MKYLLLSIFCTVVMLSSINSNAEDTISEQTLKSAFIGQFSHYINWPNRPQQLNVAYMGNDDQYWQALQNMANSGASKYPLTLSRISKAEHVLLTDAHILVIGQSHNRYISGINALLGDRATLLVSEYVTDNKLIGINFYKTDKQTLSFNLNRYNLLYQELTISEDIVLLGGSEIDVAHMVKEMTAKLSNSAKQIDKLNNHIKNQQQTITSKQTQIEQKQAQINNRNKELLLLSDKIKQTQFDHEKQLDDLASQLAQKEHLLADKQNKVSETQNELDKMNEQSRKLTALIDKNQQHIEQQTQKLNRLSNGLKEKEQALQVKEKQVEQTTNVLFISLGALIAFAVLAANLWYLSKRKQALNKLLEAHNEELENINQQLISTQKQLVESEKMASLAGLVAGVAHEVNTPLGAAITAATHLSAISTEIYSDFKDKKLSSQKFERILEEQLQATDIIFKNLCRSADLIKSFKQVSADQVSEAAREFEIGDYLHEIITSLKHELKRAQVDVSIRCDFQKRIYTYPGVFSQVITNLVINSLIHGFKSQQAGHIQLEVKQENGHLFINYTDNGCGIDKQNIDKIFDPFFTTNRNSGSTGLGLSICYNLITQKMQGNITCLESESGAHFELSFPFTIQT
ncbi:YfiR/HmsC family protein [Pseudoalteromonas sp. SS15]|uniref:YfiR/HmsC family protein n=1 Tax=Pseudoalteromonas sp. SS15 TaxID=3139393 RepID=UPI003BA9F79D